MGYLHIKNLYRPEAQDVLLFKEVYALEKIHGTSAHLKYHAETGKITVFSGGASHDQFASLFDTEALSAAFRAKFGDYGKDVTVFGEAYGGKLQGMSHVYGKELKFVVFDVKLGENWLSVPQAEDVANGLGLEFVHYEKVEATVDALNAVRDKPSVQASRNLGILDGVGEGIVIRPLIELTKNNGERLIAKHKRDDFKETRTPREVKPELAAALADAQAIAEEWVTAARLNHVLDKLDNPDDLSAMPRVLSAMVEDVEREGEGEFIPSKEVRKAINAKTAQLFKAKVTVINA